MGSSDLDPSVFKAYDIRGIVPDQIDRSGAFRNGVGVAQSGVLGTGAAVVVGHDPRSSWEEVFDGITSGLTASGVNVIDIGLCTTPMLYFAVNLLSALGGIMITASHDPKEYNGVKLVRERAIPIGSDTGLRRIAQEAATGLRVKPAIHGQASSVDTLEQYAGYFAKRFPRMAPSARLVVDTGNGAAGPIPQTVLADRGIPSVPPFLEPDGRIPNHPANPLEEKNLAALRAVLTRQENSIGIAFNGDGDRVCFLDEHGDVVRGDLITVLLGARALAKNGPSRILYDLRSSRVVPKVLQEAGGEPIKARVGHAFVKAQMREFETTFAGELSYHFYFRDFFCCESGVYALFELLCLLEDEGSSLAELVTRMLLYAHCGEINFRIEDKKSAMNEIEKRYHAGAVSRLDGLSVDFEEWWFNLRPSNTEPFLRLSVEAESRALMEEKMGLVTGILSRCGSRCS